MTLLKHALPVVPRCPELRAARRAREQIRLRHDPAVLPPPLPDAQKRTAHASEQDRPDVLKRRRAWSEGQLDLDPKRLIFIDESWANIARTHGRTTRGERVRMSVLHGHWKTTTFVAGLTRRGMIAPFVIGGPINRTAFETYVARVLVPDLRSADIVMDNLPSPFTPAECANCFSACGYDADW